MAERFAKVNEQEIRELLDNTTPKIPCLRASLAMSSYTTRANGIIVKYLTIDYELEISMR